MGKSKRSLYLARLVNPQPDHRVASSRNYLAELIHQRQHTIDTQTPEIEPTASISSTSHSQQSAEESKLLETAKIQKRIAPMQLTSAIDPKRGRISFADSAVMDGMGLDGGQVVQQLPDVLSAPFEAQRAIENDSEMQQVLPCSSKRIESPSCNFNSKDFGDQLSGAVLQPIHQNGPHTESQNSIKPSKPTDAEIQDYLLRDTVVQKHFQEKLDEAVAETTRKVRIEEFNRHAKLQKEMQRVWSSKMRESLLKLSAAQDENRELKRMHAETVSQLELERRKTLASPQVGNSNSHLRPLTNLDIAQVLQNDPGSARLFKKLAQKELGRYREKVKNEYRKAVDDIKRDYNVQIPRRRRNIEIPAPEVGYYVGPQPSPPQQQAQTQLQNEASTRHRQPDAPSPPSVRYQAQSVSPPSNEEKAFIYDKLVASGKIKDLKADTMQKKVEYYDMLVDSKVIRWGVM